MLRPEPPDDHVVTAGITITPRDMGRIAFDRVGSGMVADLVIDPELFRPLGVDVLLGEPAKATAKLGWTAETSPEEVIVEPVEADLARLFGPAASTEPQPGSQP